jgi:hypothetical protein
MKDSIVLFLAYDGDRPIAGALNFVSPDCLYGRYWGCTRDVPFLHFELCYYQAIDYAIAHGLPRVEAGAQGEHKLARGYQAVPTYSAHYRQCRLSFRGCRFPCPRKSGDGTPDRVSGRNGAVQEGLTPPCTERISVLQSPL